jgi:hypothetical protein
MSDFKDKCGDVLTGGATGASGGGRIGAVDGPLIVRVGATICVVIGGIAGLFSDYLKEVQK